MNKKLVVIGMLSALMVAPAFAAMPTINTSGPAYMKLVARDGAERTNSGSTEKTERAKPHQNSMKVASDGAEHLEKWRQQFKKT